MSDERKARHAAVWILARALAIWCSSQTVALADGAKEDTYKYEMGNSPNGARATLYFYYDLGTIGLAEPVFTLIELLQGHDEVSKIVYSSDDRVLDIKGYIPVPPSPELKAAQEAQAQHAKRPAKVAEPSPAAASEGQSFATMAH